jgi:protein Tex
VDRVHEELILPRLARELALSMQQVRSCASLLDEGNTVPFIARYRKEATGEMDEEQIRNLQERLTYLRNLAQRKEDVIRSIAEQGKLTPELESAIRQADKLQEVEDLYRPFRPKRRTRAMIAREKGLEPLAEIMLDPEAKGYPLDVAAQYVDPEKGVASAEDALAGARDIVAEVVSDDAEVRKIARELTTAQGVISAVDTGKGDPEKAQEFEMYREFREPLRTLPPHRTLALNRGERIEVLRVTLEAPSGEIVGRIERKYITNPRSPFADQLREAIADSYKRLIEPSIETEVRGALTERAEERAIHLFAENLRNLLLQAPVKGITVMGVDPGYRTGCKIAVVDETGKVLATDVVYITMGEGGKAEGARKLHALVDKFKVDLIAIGNGTASRETELVVAEVIPHCKHKTAYTIVSEAGASVYSASKVAAQEFPEFDVTQRSAVSIARRLQDPLAELVKIDPKSIGVGLYQHDVDQKRLAEQLGAVVESCVNSVGVNLNTASPSLLQYVAGIKATVAKAIVEYREKHGKFRSRQELLKVSGLGPKAFEQCAGFLRVSDGAEPLDSTAVHPESYHLAEAILKAVGATRTQLIGQGAAGLRDALKELTPEQVAKELGAGIPTVRDIIDSMQKPGRDPREDLPKPIFRTDVLKIEDLQPGMELMGTVRNVIDFGAFVDIGVHEDGLVHISQLSHKYVKHPSDVISLGDVVKVRVLEVDLKRQRIGLTMKLGEAPPEVAGGDRPARTPAPTTGRGPVAASGRAPQAAPPAKPASLDDQLKALQQKFNKRP